MEEARRPKVGVGVFVVKDNKILMQKRIGAHGVGTWSLPGGHLEFGESVEDCARREVLEELGVEIKNIRLGPYTNDIFETEGKHYITLFVISDYKSGEPRVLEPDRTTDFNWFSWGSLPQPLFLPLDNLIKSGFNL